LRANERVEIGQQDGDEPLREAVGSGVSSCAVLSV